MKSSNTTTDELLLYAVTDRAWLGNETLYEQVEKALKGGATFVQLREKKLDEESFLQEAIEIKELCKKYNVPFVINDNVDIAIKMDADGVHVGQSDIDAKSARKLIGEGKILGVSARTLQEAKRAKEDGADYIGIGAMFSTSTKLDAKSVSFETLKEIKDNVDIPFVLIGGINLGNVEKLKQFNPDGYVIISAILKEEDIYAEVKKWLDVI